MSIAGSKIDRSLGEDTSAAGSQTSGADLGKHRPFLGGGSGVGDGASNALASAAIGGSPQDGGGSAGRVPSSSCLAAAASPKIQLQQPGAAPSAAFAAAAIKNHAATHASFGAFAAQAARSTSIGPVFRKRRATAAVPALPHEATGGMMNPQPGERPGVAEAASNTSASMRISGGEGLARNNSGHNRGAGSSTGGGGGSTGGRHAGAAYCIIPQPAFQNDNRYRQHQQPLRPPQASYGSGSSRGCITGLMAPVFSPPTVASGGGMVHSQSQYRHQHPSQAAGDATSTAQNPTAAARPTTARRRARGRGEASPLTPPDTHPSSNSDLQQPLQRPQGQQQLPQQRQRGLIGGPSLRRGVGNDGGRQSDSTLSAEVRLERSREQNRQSSKKARVRRKGEEECLKEEIVRMEVFKLMVEEAPDMMSIHSLDHRAHFRYASGAYQRIAGMNPRDVIGRGLTDIVVMEDRDDVQQALLKVAFSHATHRVVSYGMVTPDATPLAVETTIRKGDQCLICVARAVSPKKPPPPLPPALPPHTLPPAAVPPKTTGTNRVGSVSIGGGGGSNHGGSSGGGDACGGAYSGGSGGGPSKVWGNDDEDSSNGNSNLDNDANNDEDADKTNDDNANTNANVNGDSNADDDNNSSSSSSNSSSRNNSGSDCDSDSGSNNNHNHNAPTTTTATANSGSKEDANVANGETEKRVAPCQEETNPAGSPGPAAAAAATGTAAI